MAMDWVDVIMIIGCFGRFSLLSPNLKNPFTAGYTLPACLYPYKPDANAGPFDSEVALQL